MEVVSLEIFCLVVCGFALFKNKHCDFSPAEFSLQQGIMEEEILDRQVIIFLPPHFKAHSTCFASPFLCPSY